jgi:hypothetical protein
MQLSTKQKHVPLYHTLIGEIWDHVSQVRIQAQSCPAVAFLRKRDVVAVQGCPSESGAGLLLGAILSGGVVTIGPAGSTG